MSSNCFTSALKSWRSALLAIGGAAVAGLIGNQLDRGNWSTVALAGCIVGILAYVLMAVYQWSTDYAKFKIPKRRSLAEALRRFEISSERFHGEAGLVENPSALYGQGLNYGVRAAITTLHPVAILGGLGIAAILHVGASLIDSLFGPSHKELADKAWASIDSVLQDRQRTLASKIYEGIDAVRSDLPLLAASRLAQLNEFQATAQGILAGS